MRPIVVFNRITLDGFFAGPNGEIDWFIPDMDLDTAIHSANTSNTLLCGRLTYQMFEAVWPQMAKDPNAPKAMRDTGQQLNEMTKVVFSTTLKDVTWENTQLKSGNLVEQARNLKQADGSTILIFGSGTIIQQLASAALIDEYFIALTPVILGAGKKMFESVDRFPLKLVDEQHFATGNVLLHYRL